MPPETLRAGEVLLDPAGGLDEVDAVVGVLLDAGRQGEAVGVEDDVLGREADLVDEDPVGALADLLAALEVVGLALLVEGHHDRGGAVLAAQAGLLAELVLALLHGDRVDDRLALHAAQAGLDHLPLGGVDHHRHPADVGLAGDQLGEAVHRRDAVDHPLVHVDVDDLGAGLDLLRGHGERGVVVAGLDQVAELRRAGDVGALADVDEQRVLGDVQRLEAGEPHRGHRLGGLARRRARRRRRRCAEMCSGVVPQQPPTRLTSPALANSASTCAIWSGGLVVLTEGVGQPGVGVARDEAVGDAGELGEVGPDLGSAPSAQLSPTPAAGRAGPSSRTPR